MLNIALSFSERISQIFTTEISTESVCIEWYRTRYPLIVNSVTNKNIYSENITLFLIQQEVNALFVAIDS